MSWNASQLVLRLTKGPINCTGDNVDIFNDIQKTATCHVCLSTGAVVGLAFHAQTGLISLVALLALLYIVARNYIRNHHKPPPGPWRLFRGNVDILMLNVIVADMIMSLGAISDIRWAYDRQVYCGSFCDAQGIVKTLGETAAALSTLAVAIYTFIAVNSRRPPVYRPWICLITVVIIWLWCILWPVILLRKYDTPGPGGEEDVHYAYTPTPWWCWINSKYLPERIVAEYLWLWIAGIFSIGLYIPAYYIVRNQQNMFREPVPDADRRSVTSTIDETNEAVKMLWYPLAYTLCVLPLSIMRWAAFANPDLLNRSQVMPATMVFSSIFNLMGLINVLLIYWTRPAILLIGSDGTLPPTDPRYTLSKEEVSPNSSLQSLPPNGNIGQDSHQASSRRGDNGFGGENVSLPREPVA
ncbi:G protein coupled glucose receptor regulating Gpa2 protein [Rhizoctonia solani]|uniref:G protein coupled glucose receptor regulating Gpa2 protein n=1 Tax=Rhizoctonia solani TaxID=456999 RepID=A0A8H8NNU2_9AGAM|nr:G protein coupled glucose receptor regulating Gpa2 protein [Rhizoctonia solani]QRW17206.1 G protein coupled glucose receptor regulating Gpa2 protein [Rhizoctonia solani]